MSGCRLPSHLLHTAHSVVEAASRIAETGGSAIHAALLASQLYEALKLELAASRQQPAKMGLLAAAIDQCRRAAARHSHAEMIAAELRATLELLQGGATLRLVANGGVIGASRPKPELRVIAGGLSRSARA